MSIQRLPSEIRAFIFYEVDNLNQTALVSKEWCKDTYQSYESRFTACAGIPSLAPFYEQAIRTIVEPPDLPIGDVKISTLAKQRMQYVYQEVIREALTTSYGDEVIYITCKNGELAATSKFRMSTIHPKRLEQIASWSLFTKADALKTVLREIAKKIPDLDTMLKAKELRPITQNLFKIENVFKNWIVHDKNKKLFENVTILDLKKSQLNYLPPSILHLLSKLESLDLSNNNLAVLPPEIKELKSLKTLKASNNKLAELPKEISELQLDVCILTENPLKQENLPAISATHLELPD
jgi:hypothetical protein